MNSIIIFFTGFAVGILLCLTVLWRISKWRRGNWDSFVVRTVSLLLYRIRHGILRGVKRFRYANGQEDILKVPKSDYQRDYVNGVKNNVTMWNIFSNAMPIHVYIKNADDDFRYVYSNQTRNVFFGRTNKSMIGQNDTSLLTLENAQKQLACDAEIMSKPQGIYDDIIEVPDQQGKTRYFRMAQTQYTDETGNRLLLGAALDITELEESRRLLNESKKRLEERELWLSRTLTSIGDGVIVTDTHGATVLLNPVAERMLGVRSKEVMGKPHDEYFRIVGAMDNEPRLSPVGRALRTGAIVELANHTDLISQTGERYHISDSAAPILDEQHNILGAVLVFRDVTEAYLRRAELRKTVNDWEMASLVSGIASFRMDYQTRKVTGSQRLSEFWPIINGVAVTPELWVLPEDLGNGQALMAAVAEGKEDHTSFSYRVFKEGKIRHYRIFGAVDREHPGIITGIIQDTTESYENEKQLQNTKEMWNSLIDALPLNFFAKNVDDSFRYTHCNRRFAEFVGYEVEDIIGRTDEELFQHPTDITCFHRSDMNIVTSGKSCNYTESIYGLDNRPTQFQTVKMPCIGQNGEHLLLGISIDITELVKLNKSQEVLRQGLEMLVTETDLNEGIANALKAVYEYIGVSRSFIFHFDLEKRTVSCVREYCQTGESALQNKLHNQPYSTEMDWEAHFEKECFFNIPELQDDESLKMLGPYYTDLIKKYDFRSFYSHRLIIDGKFWGYVGLAYEKEIRILDKGELDFVQAIARFIELMIRHKRTQEELHEAVVQANAAEKAKSCFLATMSHEIRTPLNAVIGYSELLKDGTLPEKIQKDYLNDISIAGNALLALINDILDLSKLDAEKMQFAKTPIEFSELVHESIIVFQQKLKEKHLEYESSINNIPRIKSDPLRLRQIIFNLFGNAIKFTDHGKITITAQFAPDDNGRTGTLTFEVKDTGCGISEEDSKQLFQPFMQSQTLLGTRLAGSGSGLGLLLVRRMLDLMNGTISLTSTPGVGSIFSVVMREVEYLEVDKSSVVTDSVVSDSVENHESVATTVSYNILLVDDVAMNLKVMQAMLHKLGTCTVTANNAESALALLEKQSFDMLLTDLWMPGMNGIELADKIRRSGKYPHLKIAMVTADSEAGISFDSKTFDTILTKPITMKNLSHFIRMCSRLQE